MRHALIVDDDQLTAAAMAELIAAEQLSVATAGSVADARRLIAAQRPDVVLLDLVLPDGNGLALLDDPLLRGHADVVLITGHPSFGSSVQALRLGAADYLTKPLDFEQLRCALSRLARSSMPVAQPAVPAPQGEQDGFGLLLGRSSAMQRVYRQLSRVADTGVTVFITGESGTGKERAARSVHDLSRRRDKPFVALNCGAISPNLIESELFGHEKGSFTGADRQREGYFERACGGTLFLDEITEMPLDLQVKLLRVLETGSFTRVGSTQDQQADVRVVATTNRVPQQAVAQGKLREDLLYRLNVFPIAMPPLRERGDDVVLMAEHFMERLLRKEGQAKLLSAQALQRLSAYRWPGNVRELRNAIERAYLMTAEAVITDEWLPGITSSGGPQSSTAREAITIRLGSSLADAERELILATLRYLDQHKDRAAAMLGVSRKTLYNRLQEYASGRDEPPP